MAYFWKWPWKFKQTNLIFFSLVIVGFLIEYFSGSMGRKAPVFPLNLYILLSFIFFSVVLYYSPFFKRYRHWVLSFQFVITAVTWVGVLSILSGIFPQGRSALPLFFEKIALSSVTRSIPYLILVVLICQSLLFACLNRFSKISFGEIPFLLNHLGLFIIFTASILGSGDLIRLKMDLNTGKTERRGYRHHFGMKVDLPFALRLEKFKMDVYPSKLLVVSRKDGTLITDITIFPKGENDFIKEFQLTDWNLKIKNYYSDSFQVDDHFIPSKHIGAAPALQLTVTDKVNQKTVSGWIGTGSFISPAKLLDVNEDFSIALSNPQPKAYQSEISYFMPNGQSGKFNLRVNHPFSLSGWKIYQYGYDVKKGKWSNFSIVEVIKDPWLPVVYAGIYMLMAGSILMLVVKKIKGERPLSKHSSLA